MVKASEVNNDIRAIAKKVKTAVFSYDEIHNENILNEFHYDYGKVIDEVAKINDWDKKEATKQLIHQGILSPLPNGEYKVEVGASTKGGGGLNYHGTAFFTMAAEDYQVKYHELAHSLQKEYHLFDDEKINKLYRSSAQGLDDGNAENLQINRIDYEYYLNEMHSESFSYAAMMLRAENTRDFIKQVYKAYNDARNRNGSGFFSFGKTEYGGDKNNAKFYSTFPVMKETIKTVLKIRKQGKVKEFFDKDGVLKDEKLAKLCEQAVIKAAYSPRTLNAYFKYRFFDGHNSKEHGWRRDTAKSVATFLHGSVMWLVTEDNLFGKVKKILKHRQLEAEEKKKINKVAGEYKIFKDDETQALYDYIHLSTRCSQIAEKYKGDDFLTASTLSAQSLSVLRYDEKLVHEPSIRDQARLLADNLSSKKKEALGNDMVDLRYWVRDRKDNPYFCHLVANDIELSDVIRMYNEKLKNPEKRQIESPTPIKTYTKKENPYSSITGVRRCMFPISDFMEKFNCSDTFRQALVNLSLQGTDKLDDPQIRKSLASSFHFSVDFFGIRKRRFVKELNETLDKVSQEVFSQRLNLSYDTYKKQFKGMKLEDILEKTKSDRQEYDKQKQTDKAQTKEKSGKDDVLKATDMILNNVEAANYLADRYGLSDKLRIQLQKMAVMPQEKSANKELRKALLGVVNFDNDWFGREKRSFERDFNKLMDGFVADAEFQKNNPAYAEKCQEMMSGLSNLEDIGRKLKEKEQVNETVKIEEPVNKAESVKKEEPVAEAQSVQQTEAKAEDKAEAAKSPKDVVAEKLKALGIEDGTYMLIDKNDDFYTLYSGANGPEGRSVKGYLESGEEQIAKTGKDAVYCSNNGIVGAYFKEGVYVLTTDYELKSALRFRGEETSLGVMLSNGEPFVNKDGQIDDTAKALNLLWRGDDKNDGIKGKGDKIYAKRAEAYQARQKWLEEMKNATAADKVHHSLEQLCELGDKYDKSGHLKESLVNIYIKEPDKMLGLEFWGDVVNKYAEKTPESKDKMILEISKVGGDIAKEVKLNTSDPAYNAVKKRCEECLDSTDMVKTAKVCSMRSHSQAEEFYKAAASR